MPYPEMYVAPMRAELINEGFTELKSEVEVAGAMQNAKGTSIVVVNSVCGCAAGAARPGVIRSLANDKKPDNLFTVFAGQDLEAVAEARKYMLPYPPSSPSMAIFKDGKLVHFVQRMDIEGYSAEQIASNLKEVYNKYC